MQRTTLDPLVIAGALVVDGPATPDELAQVFRVPPPLVVERLEHLEAEGLACRGQGGVWCIASTMVRRRP